MSEFSSFEDLSTWATQETPTVSGGEIAPDGSSNAYLVGDDSETTEEGIRTTGTAVTTTETVHRTFWVKPQPANGVYCGFRIRFDTGGVTVFNTCLFDPETGEIWDAVTNSFDAKAVAMVSGYWRIDLTSTNNSTGNTRNLDYILPAIATAKTGATDVTATGTIIAFVGTQTPHSTFEDKFLEWDFTATNGRRVGPRPVPSSDPADGDRFASPTGTGGGLSYGDPASLTAATAAAQGGELIFLLDGIYIIDEYRWTPPANTTWESYPGEIAIFEADQATIPADPHNSLAFLWIDNPSTTLRNIETRFFPNPGMEIRGDSCKALGVYAHHNGITGIIIRNSTTGNPTGNLIEDCIAEHNSDVGRPADGGNADGLGVAEGTDNTIRYSVAGWNSDDGIDVWGGANSTVEYCVAHNSGIASGNGNGYKMGSGIAATNTVRYCLAFNNKARGFDGNITDGVVCSYNSALGSGSVDFQSYPNQTYSYNVATGALNVSDGTHIDNSWDRNAGMAYEETNPYLPGFMVPVAGYEDIGAMSPSPAATLSAPTNTPVFDGAVVGCASDSTEGIIYLAARNDRQWYSVANGDSQELADADKAVIISQTVSGPVVFVDTVNPAVLDPSVAISGLPSADYYVGWVQDA